MLELFSFHKYEQAESSMEDASENHQKNVEPQMAYKNKGQHRVQAVPAQAEGRLSGCPEVGNHH